MNIFVLYNMILFFLEMGIKHKDKRDKLSALEEKNQTALKQIAENKIKIDQKMKNKSVFK